MKYKVKALVYYEDSDQMHTLHLVSTDGNNSEWSMAEEEAAIFDNDSSLPAFLENLPPNLGWAISLETTK